MSFFAGFVQGVFQGKDWRDNKNDRKREQGIADERLDWEREDRGWTGEARDRQRQVWTQADEDRARTNRERQRGEDNQAEFEDIVDGLEGGGQPQDRGTPAREGERPPRTTSTRGGASARELSVANLGSLGSAADSVSMGQPATGDPRQPVPALSMGQQADGPRNASATPAQRPNNARGDRSRGDDAMRADEDFRPQPQRQPLSIAIPAVMPPRGEDAMRADEDFRPATRRGAGNDDAMRMDEDFRPVPPRSVRGGQPFDQSSVRPEEPQQPRSVRGGQPFVGGREQPGPLPMTVNPNGSSLIDAAQGRGQASSDYTEATRGFRSDAPQRGVRPVEDAPPMPRSAGDERLRADEDFRPRELRPRDEAPDRRGPPRDVRGGRPFRGEQDSGTGGLGVLHNMIADADESRAREDRDAANDQLRAREDGERAPTPSEARAQAIQSGAGGIAGRGGMSVLDAVTDAGAVLNRAGTRVIEGVGAGLSVVSPSAGAAVFDAVGQMDRASDRLAGMGEGTAAAPMPPTQGLAPAAPSGAPAAPAPAGQQPTAQPGPAQPSPARAAPAPSGAPFSSRFNFNGNEGTISGRERVSTNTVADVVPRETQSGTPAPSVAIAGKAISARFSAGFSIRDAANPQAQARPKASEVRATAREAVKRFDEDGIRRLEQHFIRNGEFGKAEQWRSFATSANTQAALGKWVEAMTYWQMNDEDGFLDSVADVYNSRGYYEDGLSVLREGTEFRRDEGGNIIGASITFRDDASGETFRRNIQGPRDLVGAAIIGALSPEQVFEQGMAEAQAMAAQQEADARGMSLDDRVQIETRVTALATEMGKITGVTPEIYEQARQIVERQLGINTGGNVPVLTD